MPTSEEAAAAAAAELVSDEAEVEETPSGSETEEVTDFPTFDIEIPPELAAELEEEEIDIEVTDQDLDELAVDYEEADRTLLRRLVAAEKRATHLESLRTKDAKKGWEEEAKKFFPLAEPFLPEIQATSRRGFLRTAKNVHERMVPIVEQRVLTPARAAIEAEKQKALAEGKQEARDAWGNPVVKDDVPSEARVSLQVTEGRRRRGELSDTIKNMLFPSNG